MNIGRAVVVKNMTGGLNRRSRKRIAEFHQMTYLTPGGSIGQILLTDQELEAALTRSVDNEKSLLKITWLDRLVAFKIRLIDRFLSFFKAAKPLGE